MIFFLTYINKILCKVLILTKYNFLNTYQDILYNILSEAQLRQFLRE